MKKQEVEAVKVEKIVIKIGDDEQELTVEAAKELQKILNDLFGNKENVYVYPSSPIYIPYPYVIHPYYPDPDRTVPYYQPYRIWCTYTTDNTTLCISDSTIT
jgi:hypothetical protein